MLSSFVFLWYCDSSQPILKTHSKTQEVCPKLNTAALNTSFRRVRAWSAFTRGSVRKHDALSAQSVQKLLYTHDKRHLVTEQKCLGFARSGGHKHDSRQQNVYQTVGQLNFLKSACLFCFVFFNKGLNINPIFTLFIARTEAVKPGDCGTGNSPGGFRATFITVIP